MAVVAACGTSGPTTTPGSSRTAPPTDVANSAAPGATAEPATPDPEPTPAPDTPEPGPTDAPLPTDEPEPIVTPAVGAVARCAGTDDNRDFYAAVAASVTWPVYCPALPRGWNVESGQYSLAGGGRMEISYRGPGGAGLRLQEGAFCQGAACVPSGENLGSTAFGDRDGVVIAVEDGYAVAVDGGARVSWLLIVTGVDEQRARSIAANLVRLDD